MENMEFWLLILIAVLEVVDGQGIALRILRLIITLMGGDDDGQKVKKVKSNQL